MKWSSSEEMPNSDAKISNVEVQIIPLCIRYQTSGNSDWKPIIGQFMWYEIDWFPTHSFGQGIFQSWRFIITFLNWRNFFPWRGLVKKSATIFSVGQYSILRSPFLIRLVIKKYLIFRCLVLLELESLPLFSRIIADWLSWYIIVYWAP